MPRTPDFTVVETPRGWMLSTPARMTEDGKRHRKYYPDKTAAEKAASKLRGAYASGVRGAVISATLALQAAAAERILAGTGISLLEAARIAVARAGDKASPETFRKRLERAHEANKTRWSHRYALDVSHIPNWVPKWFLESKCSAITRSEVERALTEAKPIARSTIDMRSSRIMAVLNYRERHHKKTEIEILDKDQVKSLLDAAQNETEKRVVALLLYAGIRPDAQHGEIRRLDWSAVGKTEIYVSREVSKTTDRHIPITPSLAKLIENHPKSGLVAPSGWKKIWSRIRSESGIDGQDVTRHTFASNFLAAFGEDATKAALGHSQGSQTLFRHYRRAVTKEAGDAYFA